jgi:hypothetical protein
VTGRAKPNDLPTKFPRKLEQYSESRQSGMFVMCHQTKDVDLTVTEAAHRYIEAGARLAAGRSHLPKGCVGEGILSSPHLKTSPPTSTGSMSDMRKTMEFATPPA